MNPYITNPKVSSFLGLNLINIKRKIPQKAYVANISPHQMRMACNIPKANRMIESFRGK